LRKLVRAEFLVDAVGLNKVDGLPFRRIDVQAGIVSHLDALGSPNGNGASRAAEEAL
jgi:hypothetical protein